MEKVTRIEEASMLHKIDTVIVGGGPGWSRHQLLADSGGSGTCRAGTSASSS